MRGGFGFWFPASLSHHTHPIVKGHTTRVAVCGPQPGSTSHTLPMEIDLHKTRFVAESGLSVARGSDGATAQRSDGPNREPGVRGSLVQYLAHSDQGGAFAGGR